MKKILLIFALFIGYFSVAQTTEELFTIEGLSINHLEQSLGGTKGVPFTYKGKTNILGYDAQEYTSTYSSKYLIFKADKIYTINYDASLYLLYDFGLNVGDTISEGKYKGQILKEISRIRLFNGELRRKFDFVSELRPTEISYSWVDGIGDITNGILGLETICTYYYFECAKIGDQLIFGNNSEYCHCNTTTKTKDVSVDDSIKLSPNPASDYIQIQSDKKILKVDIINLEGQVLFSLKNLNPFVDISNLENGIYFMKITNEEDDVFLRKFIKD